MRHPFLPSPAIFLLAACALSGLAPASAAPEDEPALEESATTPVVEETEDEDEENPTPALIEPDLIPAETPELPADLGPPGMLSATAEGKALHTAWIKAGYKFNPEVRAAFLSFSKAQAKADLTAANETLPADFLAWVDSDPLVEATVYGVKSKPANVLRILRSLDVDLGSEVVRKQYTQLALAMAVSNADAKDFKPLGINLAERPVMKLVIPPNPLKPVDTKDPKRTLDENDHIINFLNSKPFEYEVKIKPAKKGDPVTTEKRTRPMVGADVIKSKELQARFNAYMEEKGQGARIDCPPIDPNKYGQMGPVVKAAKMFQDAYMAKGLLPQRDAFPSLAETCAFLIRNDQHTFPAEANRVWPIFPLKAPWPALTLLAVQRDPLRECQEIWENYRELGRGNKKGPDYVGTVAQKPDLLRARSVAPLDFGYGSVQMMCKDGGVCGVQSGVSARTQLALGRPATTTIETGHCGTTGVRFDKSNNTYNFGSGKSPVIWPYSNPASPLTSARRAATTGFAVNHGMPSFLDSLMAARLWNLVSPADREAHGLELVKSGLDINPYNILLVEAAASLEPLSQLHLFKWLTDRQAAVNKPGCPVFMLHALEKFTETAVSKPIPENKDACREIHAFLLEKKIGTPASLARYQAAAEGLPALLTQAEAALKTHLASARNKKTCMINAQVIQAACQQIPDKTERIAWAKARLADMSGSESYLAGGGRRTTDPVFPILSKFAGVKPPSEQVLMQSFLDGLTTRLQAELAGTPDPRAVAKLLAEVRAVLPRITDAAQKKQWKDSLIQQIGDRPLYQEFKQSLIKSEWKVIAASRESKVRNGLASRAIDGSAASYWHTFNSAQDEGGVPQEFSVDMGELKNLTGFTYLPRVSMVSGMVDQCAFHTSVDGNTWTLVAQPKFDTLPASIKAKKPEQTVTFAPTQARYFKFVARHVLKDNHCAVAEIGVIETSAAP